MAFIISFCAMSIAAILIPLYFVYQDNKRKAAAGKGRLNDILHYKNYIWAEVRLSTL